MWVKMKEQDKKKEWEMFNEVWRFVKDFYIPERTEEWWEAYCERAREIDKKCQSRLGQKLINAFGDYLDEKIRGERDGG